MTLPSDQPAHRNRPERVSVWRFALFLAGLAAFAFLTWRELPQLMGWRDRPPATVKDAAGDVAIDARMAPTGRISNLPEYVVQYYTSVGFAPGSAMLTNSGRQLLDNVMNKGDTLRAYLIEVAGFADAAGAEASNAGLRAARADTVIAYLARARSVPLQRIVNATGLDTSRAGDALPTVKGGQHAKNRRVDVRVVVIRRGRPK